MQKREFICPPQEVFFSPRQFSCLSENLFATLVVANRRHVPCNGHRKLRKPQKGETLSFENGKKKKKLGHKKIWESRFLATESSPKIIKQVFFSPITCTYTSLPLDGMARIFFLHGCARACKSSCLDPFNSYLLIPEERRKHLDWAGIEPRSSCFTSDRSDH